MGPGPGGVLALPKRLALRLLVGHLFHRHFSALSADTEELRKAVYQLRFEVYSRELGWEDPQRFPDQMESDDYDADSMHVLLHHKASGSYAGTVRLVRTPEHDPHKPLPFELSCGDTLYPETRTLLASGRTLTGEISRLAVPARFRRRVGEKAPVGDVPLAGTQRSGKFARTTPPIAMSLYVAAACSGLEAGLDSVFALMEPRLASRLLDHGIQFRQMGDPIEHRGQRAPFRITRQGLFESIDPKARALLEVIRGDLRRHSRRI